MLYLSLPELEFFDEDESVFVTHPALDVKLEHSLVSLSKWESKFEKPFLSRTEKTVEETEAYIDLMNVDENAPSFVYRLTQDEMDRITEYIGSKQTATTISQQQNRPMNREIITSEIIYYWMISMNIPFECQFWHLEKLLCLIQVCSIKNTPPKKMSRNAAMNRQRSLNAQRRAALGTSG